MRGESADLVGGGLLGEPVVPAVRAVREQRVARDDRALGLKL
jgi:hypothetical protein